MPGYIFCFKVIESKIRWLFSEITWQFGYAELAKLYSKLLLGYVKYHIMNSFNLICFMHGIGKSMQNTEDAFERLCSLCIVVSKIFQHTKSIKFVLQFQVIEWKNPSPFNSYLKSKTQNCHFSCIPSIQNSKLHQGWDLSFP